MQQLAWSRRRAHLLSVGRVFLAALLVFMFLPLGSKFSQAQSINGDPTGDYSIRLDPISGSSGEPVTEFTKGQNPQMLVSLDISGAQTSLTNPTVVVSTPEYAAFTRASASKITLNGEPVNVRAEWHGQEVHLQFNELNGGDKVRFYVDFKPFNDEGMVYVGMLFYNKQPLRFNAQLKSGEGEVLATSNDLVLFEKVINPKLRYQEEGPETIEGGPLVQSPAGSYIDPAKARSTTQKLKFEENISFPVFPGQERLMESGEVSVKLPEYQNLATNTLVKAQFDASKSKGWKLSSDGSSIVTQFRPFMNATLGSYSSLDVPTFALKFPGAANNSNIQIQASFKLNPFRPWPEEPLSNYQGTASKTLKIVGREAVSVTPLKIKVSKAPQLLSIDDNPTDKAKAHPWLIKITNESEDSLQNATIIDTPDPRSYISGIDVSDSSNDQQDLMNAIKAIEGVPVSASNDQAWEPVNFSRSWFDGKISIRNAANYKALKFTLKKPIAKTGAPLSLGGISLNFGDKSYKLTVQTKLRDPEAVTYQANNPENNKIVNNVSINGEISDSGSDQTESAQASMLLKEYKLKYKLNADISPKRIAPYEGAELHIRLGNDVMAGQSIKNRKLAIVLPASIDVVSPSEIGTPLASPNPKHEIVDNYNNSGQRVMLIPLPDLRRSTMGLFDGSEELTVYLRSNKFVTNEELQIPIYYSFDSVENAQFINPSTVTIGNKPLIPMGQPFGLNFNPQATNAAQAPYIKVALNTLANQVLVANSLVGTDQANLNPYSIDIKENQDFVFGLNIYNYSNTVARGLVLYDTLPHIADNVILPNKAGEYTPRGSSMNAQLTGPIVAPSGYTVSYLTEEPPADINAALALPSWTEQPADYSTVRAVKIVANDGVELDNGKNLLVTLPVRAQGTLNATSLMANSFAYKSMDMPTYVEANLAIAAAPLNFHLTKIWNKTDQAKLPDAVTVQVMNGKTAYQEVQLTKENNWELDLALPRYEGFKEAQWSFVEVNPDENTWVASRADENGQPVFVNSELVNIEVEHSFKAADGRVLPNPLPELNFDLTRKTADQEAETVSTMDFGADKPGVQTAEKLPAFTADNPAKPYIYELKAGNKSLGEDWVTTIKVASVEPATGALKLEAESLLTNPNKNFQVEAVWEGDQGYEQLRPKDLELKASLKDQELKKLVLAPNEQPDQNWKGSVDLPTYQAGEVATYDFTVPELRYYTSKVTVEGDKVVVTLTFKLKDSTSQTDKPESTDEGTQTDKPDTVESGAQTDNPDTKEDGTQTEGPETTESGTQTDKPSGTEAGTQTDTPAVDDKGSQTDEEKPKPKPVPEPTPQPDPEPQPGPDPAPQPEPQPKPEPAPSPEPAPALEPGSAPKKEIAGIPVQQPVPEKSEPGLPATGDQHAGGLFAMGILASLIAILRIRKLHQDS